MQTKLMLQMNSKIRSFLHLAIVTVEHAYAYDSRLPNAGKRELRSFALGYVGHRAQARVVRDSCPLTPQHLVLGGEKITAPHRVIV